MDQESSPMAFQTKRRAGEVVKLRDAMKKPPRGWYVLGIPGNREPWRILKGGLTKTKANEFRDRVARKKRFPFVIVSEYDPFAWGHQPELQKALRNARERGTMPTLKEARRKAGRKPKAKAKAPTRAHRATVKKRVAPAMEPKNKCACGCGERCAKVFVRGHHTRLRGKLVKAIHRAREKGDPGRESAAIRKLESFGWEHYIPPKPRTRKRKTKKR